MIVLRDADLTDLAVIHSGFRGYLALRADREFVDEVFDGHWLWTSRLDQEDKEYYEEKGVDSCHNVEDDDVEFGDDEQVGTHSDVDQSQHE